MNLQYDVTAANWVLCRELTEWLSGRNYKVWWTDTPAETKLEIELPSLRDALLYKLTWGGK